MARRWWQAMEAVERDSKPAGRTKGISGENGNAQKESQQKKTVDGDDPTRPVPYASPTARRSRSRQPPPPQLPRHFVSPGSPSSDGSDGNSQNDFPLPLGFSFEESLLLPACFHSSVRALLPSFHSFGRPTGLRSSSLLARPLQNLELSKKFNSLASIASTTPASAPRAGLDLCTREEGQGETANVQAHFSRLRSNSYV